MNEGERPEGSPSETSRDILLRVILSTKKVGPEPKSSDSAVASAIVEDVLELYKRKELEKQDIASLLRGKFNDPTLKILPEALIGKIQEASVVDKPDVEVIQRGLDLASLFELSNNQVLAPEVIADLENLTAKYRPLEPEEVIEEEQVEPVLNFVPLTEEEEKREEETEHALKFGLKPIISSLPDTPQSEDLIRRLNEGDPRATSELVERAFKMGLSDYILKRYVAFIDRHPKRIVEVIDALNALSALDSQNHEAHRLLGEAYLRLERYKESAEAFHKCNHLTPKNK